MTIRREDAWAYHLATGCGVLDSFKLLEIMEPLLRERVLAVVHDGPLLEQVLARTNCRLLCDPIELDPRWGPVIEATQQEVGTANDQGPVAAAHEVTRLLLERHGIRWFSVREMNPSVRFHYRPAI